MASSPPLTVSVECVSICNWRGGGEGGWRHDCSAVSCASKTARALTGSLATTTQSSSGFGSYCYYSFGYHRRFRRRDHGAVYQSESPDFRGGFSFEASCFKSSGGFYNSGFSHLEIRKWRSGCASTSIPKTSVEVSPESLWEDLKPTISYLAPTELDKVHKALKVAFEAHDGQRRRSGEPFIIHPVEVARILGELEMDWESIAAGLLHDTVEDTDLVTFERIERDFGATVRHIVEGETKVSKLGKVKRKGENNSAQDIKADDLRQMFLAMTEEVRVIIVKLADRLHNMRTLSYMPPHKQASIASETLQVFAPLAKLLGMYQIKAELENLSFMYTNTHDHEKIARRIEEVYKEHEREMVEANKVLKRKILDDNFLDLLAVQTEVHAGCKEPYSVYKATINFKGSINDINQIAQLQIIIKPRLSAAIGPLCSEQQICYHVLGLVHSTWTPVPRSMKDYIATPKPNGYQSLHTTVIPFLYESTFRLEVQIRTEEMDLIARRGIAAHYSGKAPMNGAIVNSRNSRGKANCFNSDNISLKIGWLNAIREWQEEFVGSMTSREFVDIVTRDLLGSRVFVFTPRGEIKNLPRGATAVDYAYMIHTEVGNKMVAAKVNGNLVLPAHVLANAEVVEIITDDGLSSKSAYQRHKELLQYAKTRSARHKIMKFLREQVTLAAAEITRDSVTEFAADCEKKGKVEIPPNLSVDAKSDLEEIRRPLPPYKTTEDIHPQNGRPSALKDNGTLSKHSEHVSLNGSGKPLDHGNGTEGFMYSYETRLKELPEVEDWRSSKIAAWHSLEGNSVLWLSVICLDQRGMLADVAKTLSSLGISVCSCVTEMHRGHQMAVMLFQIEGSSEILRDVRLRIEKIHGVLEWAIGCSWRSPIEQQKLLEC